MYGGQLWSYDQLSRCLTNGFLRAFLLDPGGLYVSENGELSGLWSTLSLVTRQDALQQRVGCHLCPGLVGGDAWGLISSSLFFPFPVSHFVVPVSKALTSSGKAWRWTCVQLTPPLFPPGPKDVGYRLIPISWSCRICLLGNKKGATNAKGL